MRPQAVKAIIDGLKRAGVDFVALMPDSEFAPVQKALAKVRGIKTIQVTNESVGVSLCAGAWLGGKVPALLIPTAGLLVASWPLGSVCMAFGIPIIVIIPFRGEIGDGHWVMRTYQYTTKPALEMLQIPYSVVSRVDQVRPALNAARKSASGWLYPVALLMTGEVVW
jgi:sulfopyruvate decarboxylase subunit alpha